MLIPASDLAKQAQKFASDHAPLILTAVGTAGVITTGALAFKGGFRAADILAEAWLEQVSGYDPDSVSEIPLKRKLALTWTCYVPACGVGLLTIGAIVGANQIGTRRAAAMAAAYSISEKAFEEYRDKVQEKLGDNKERKIRDEVNHDRVNRDGPTSENTIVVTGDGDQTFQDSWSGRYFKSTVEGVNQAVNQLNHTVNLEGQASLTDFYELLGLSRTLESDELGWKADKLLDIYLSAVMHDNAKVPVLAIEYRVVPSRDYFRTR